MIVVSIELKGDLDHSPRFRVVLDEIQRNQPKLSKVLVAVCKDTKPQKAIRVPQKAIQE